MNFLDRFLIFLDNEAVTGVGTDIITKIDSGTGRGKSFQKFDKVATGAAQDSYYLLMRIGIYGAVLMFICGLIAFMVPASSQEKAQVKKKIEWVLIGVFLLCMAVTIVGWIYSAGAVTF